MAGELTVKIPISLEVIDSSVLNIKDVLAKMKPDSAGFKQLSKIMDDLVKSSGKILASFERGFSSNSEIKAAEKEIRNVEAAMESLNKLSGSISFKDLKLDTNLLKTFDKLEQDLNIAKLHYNDLLKSFGSKENGALILLVDKDLALRSFDEIQAALTSKVHEMESSAQGLQSIFAKLGELMNKITEAQKNGSYKQGDAIKNIIGEDAYKDFFLDTKRGLAFNGTKFTGKGGAKSAFIEYLKQSFTLTDADLADIRGATSAKDLERIFSDENIISGLTNKISANLGNDNNLVALLRNLLNQVNSVGSEMSGAGTALDAFKAQIMSSANVSPELAQALTLVILKMQELRGLAGAAGTQLQQFNKQTLMINQIKGMADRFLGLYQIIGFIKKGFHEMTTTIKELDTVMNGISIVTNMSTSDLWNQVDVYSKMAQQYGVSIKGAYEVSKIYYQQGLLTNDVMTLTEETLKLSKISGLDYATTTDYMTTALRGFKMEMADASKVVDVYSNLAANTAVSLQELAEAMTRTASSMESVGATFEETSAMIATMVAVTRESASNIGSAMKSIGSRYGELTKDPTKLVDEEGELMDFNKVDTALRSIGISMHTADGQFRNFTEVILELADAWKTLDSTLQRYVATQFAGNRQQSRFLALVSNGDLLRLNLLVAENSDDVGTTLTLKALDSIETKITQVTNAWQQFYLNIGLEDIWKGALTGITNILNTLNEMPKIFGKFPIVAIGVVTNAISLIRNLINSAITSVTLTIVSAASSTGTNAGKALGTNMKVTVLLDLKEIKDNIALINLGAGNSGLFGKGNWAGQAEKSLGNIASIMGTIASAASLFAISMNDGSRAAELTSGWITNIGGLLQLAAGVLMTIFGSKSAGIMMIVSSISSIISGISLINETNEEKIERLTKEAETLSNTAKLLKTDEKNAELLVKKYEELKTKQYESEEAAEEFKLVLNDLAAAFPQLILGFDSAGNAILEGADLENVLTEARKNTALATLEAAQAERKEAEEKFKLAKDLVKAANEAIKDDETSKAFRRLRWGASGMYQDESLSGALTETEFNVLSNFMLTANTDVSDLKHLISYLNSDLGGSLGLQGIETDTQLVDYFAENQKTLSEKLKIIIQSYLNFYNNDLENLYNEFLSVAEEAETNAQKLPDAYAAMAKFKTAYALLNDYQKTGYDAIYLDVSAWESTHLRMAQTLTALLAAQNYELNLLINKTIAATGVYGKYMPDALVALGSRSVINQFNNRSEEDLNLNPSEWYEKLGDQNPLLTLLELWKNSNNLLHNVTVDQFDDLNRKLMDSKHFGSTEELLNSVDPIFKRIFDNNSNFKSLLEGWYKEQIEEYKNAAEDAINSAAKTRDDDRQKFIDLLKHEDVTSGIKLQLLNNLLDYEEILVKTADSELLESAGKHADNLIKQIGMINTGLANLIANNGFKTASDIYDSMKAILEHAGVESGDKLADGSALKIIYDALETLYKLLPNNISLTIQSQIDSASQVIDDIISYARKAVSGVSSMEDALKVIAFFKSYLPDENIDINNLLYFNKKFTLSNAKELLPKLITAAQNKLAADNKVLSDVDTQIGENNSNINTFISKLNDDDAEAKGVLASIDQGLYNEYFDDLGKLKKGASFDKDRIIGAVKKRREEATQLEKNISILDILLKDIKAEAATVGSVMKEIAANPTKISRDTAGKLKGLNKDLYGQLTEDIYGNYFIAYADLIRALKENDEVKNSMSLSDRNTLINQTKEAQRKASRQSAIENIALNFDAVTGDMLVAWANAVGVDINEIQNKFTQNGNGYWKYNNGDVQDFLATEGLADSEAAQKAIGDSLINQEKAVKDFYSSMITSITKGKQRIEKNARTEAIVKDLTDSGYDIAEEYGYYIVNLSKNSIQDLITQVTNDSTLADADRTELLTSLNNTLKTYSFQEIFTDTLTNYAALTYEQADKLVKGMSNELGVETSLDKLIEEGILSYNTFTGTYEANLNKLIALYDTLEQLGIDLNLDAANTIRAKILQLLHDTSWTTVVENFISSSGSITYEMIGQLLNAARDNGIEGLDFDTVLSYLTSNGKTFDIKDTDLKGLLEKFGIEDDKQTKIIKDAFNTRINSLVSGYSNLSLQLTSGFSDFSQMLSIVDDLKTAGYDIDFESIFRYSDALHSWVYTLTGILTRIAQLDTLLESIVNKDSQAYKLLERQRDTLIHQQALSIDILSVVSATTKEGRNQKRGELLELVRAYNAVVTDEGKNVTAEQLNAIFNGNVATLKEVYKNLDREVTLDNIRTVANAKYQDLLNAESELDAKVGDIVSERAARIMELSGYAVVDKSTLRVTKIDTSKSKQLWLLYQRELYTAGLASLENLNKSMVEAWGEMYNIGDKSLTLISALQNANAMSISDLASLVGLSDKQISAAFLSGQVGKGNISRIGGNLIRINNWNNFMQELFTNYDKAFDTTSEAYISAYSKYLDGQIEQQTKVREQATSLISTLESATAGDLINVFLLDQVIGGDKIATAAQQAGAQFENGIIKTVNSTNMQELMSNIAELLFGEGLVNSKELAQIRSKIDTKTTASTAFANIVLNRDNISYEMIETLAEAMQVDILELLKLFKSNGHGGYQISENLGPQDFATYLGIELDDYSQRIIDNWVNTQVENVKTIANSFVSSISNGKQRINVTEENAAFIKILEDRGKISKELGGYFVDLSGKTIDEVLAVLNLLGLGENELSKYRNQVFSAFREKSTGSILSLLISNHENLDSNLVDKAIADQALGLAKEMFTYNELTGELSISLDNLLTALKQVNKGLINSKAYNTLLAQFKQTQFDSTTGVILQTLTSSTISEDLMAKFINVVGTNLTQANFEKIFSYKDGSYLIADYAAALQLVKDLGLESDKIIADVFKQRIQGFYQNFNNISSLATSGFNDYSAVKSTLEEVNKEFSHFGKTLLINLSSEDFAVYDDNLRAWILTQTGLRALILKTVSQLRDSGASWSEIETVERLNLLTFGDLLDFSSLISSLNTPKFDKNYANLMKLVLNYNVIVEEYNRAASITGKELKQLIQDADVKNILSGGVKAVETLTNVYKDLGRILTLEEVTAAYQAPISSVIAAKDAMLASVGSIITSAAAAILEAAGYLTTLDLGNGYSIIKSITLSNAQNAYNLLYNKALATGVAQQDQLNEFIVSSWKAAEQGESAAIDALSKTAGMSYQEFADLLLSLGVELGFNTLNDYIASGAIEKIGNGLIRITDINQIVSKKYNSEEYQKAYSEFIDNEIERAGKARENVTNAIDKILEAQTGDKINLTSILNKFGDNAKNALQQSIGSDLVDGILTISKDSNILLIASIIAEAARALGTLLEADIIELGDKIREAIQNYIDAITLGITGGISGSLVADIKKFADTYLGEDFFKQSDFIETAKGFLLTSDAAIRYYQALREAGSYDTSKMFTLLLERILSRDNIDTMSGIVGHIKELGKQIDEANALAASSEGAKAKAAEQTAAALRDELNLYKEIAQTSQFNNPSSYDFMGKSLPDLFLGPLNYWNSLKSMATALKKSSKSGKMGVQDFYNIATELGHLSELTGLELMFYGQSFGKGAEGAAKLIELGFSNLKLVDGSGAMINLKGIGVNIASGIGGMSDSIDKGIHEMALSQIKMLDGLIAFLETIVAMQDLGSLDSDFSGDFSFDEIFTEVNAGIVKANDQAEQLGKTLLTKIDKDEKLKTQFELVKVGDLSLYLIITDIASGKEIDKNLAELYTLILSGLYLASRSLDFTVDNIPSILSLYLINLDTKVEWADGTVTYYYHGKTYNGDKNTDFSKLIREDNIKELLKDLTGRDNIEVKQIEDKFSIKLKNNVQYTIEVGDKGLIIATDEDGHSYTGDSFADIQQLIISAYTAKNTEKSGKLVAIELGFEVGTTIAWKVDAETAAAQASEYTRNVIAGMLNKNNKQEVIQLIKEDIGKEEFEAKYGFKFEEDLTDELINDILTALVELEEIKLNIADIPGTDINVVGGVPVTLIVKKVEGLEDHLPYIIGGSTQLNALTYKEYLSSPDQLDNILKLIIAQGGTAEARQFTSNINGYKASVVETAGYSNAKVWEMALSIFADTGESLYSAYLKALDVLYLQVVSKEDTGEENGGPARKETIEDEATINQVVETAAKDAAIYTKELGVAVVDNLKLQALSITGGSLQGFKAVFELLIRSALREKYIQESNKKQAEEDERIKQSAYKTARENFDKLLQQTGYDKFRETTEWNKAAELAQQVAKSTNSDINSAEYLRAWTNSMLKSFNEWSAPENLAKIAAQEAADAATNAAGIVEESAGKVSNSADTTAKSLLNVADAADAIIEKASPKDSELPEGQSNSPTEPSVLIDEWGEALRRRDMLGGAEEQLRYMAEAEEQIIQAGQKYEEAVNAATEGPLALSSEVQAAWQEYLDALSMWKVYSGLDYANEHAVFSSPEAIDAIENSVQNIDTTTELNNRNQEDIDVALSQVRDIGDKLSTLMQERELEMNEPGSTEWEGDLSALNAEIAATISDLGSALSELESLTGEAANTISAAGETISGITGPISDVARALETIPGAVGSANSAIDTTSSKLSAMKSADVHFGAYFNGSPVNGSRTAIINIETKVNGGGGEATGNVALAAGTRTLMGELGPELVVSNGRYFVAGQNGAEFVDLDKDAIVFNHLQTQRLLANGSAGRGTPFTNVRNATSMATGNVTGPAKASASAVLSQLKQIRAQWQSIAKLSIADLAGKGGGGGGGGNKQIPGFIRDVERWYNWLQKIADLEKLITYQEQLRSKIQSDMVSSGDAYFKSLRKTYQDARDSALTSESLFLSQKEYFNKRRQQLNNSPLSELYTFDESGQLHFQDGSYEWLANLFKTDDYGNLSMSPKQQYQAIIKRNRNFAQYMRYDDSGKKINRKDYKSDDEYYVAMVKAFSDRMDAEKKEMQELFDSWNDQLKAVLELMQAMNELLQAMKDNQKEVEEAVIGAIEEMREREIEEMQNTRDALEETNQNFIDGLSDLLNKERLMYQNNLNDLELQRNRRLLAILQRSGASASQIALMQQKIDKQSQDLYFEKQQEQIDAVKEASDNQIEKLDMQIELAQELLEFEKAHGLLWGQVYEVMARTPQEITDFIKENTEEFWGKSPLANSEDLDNTLFLATQWTAFRDDVEMQNAAMGRIDLNLDIFMGALEQIYGKQANWDKIKKESEAKYKEYWGIDDEDPNATAWDAYPGKNDDIAAHTTNTMGVDTSTTTASTSSGGGGRTGLENKWYHNDKTHWKRLWNNGSWSKTQEGSHSLVTTGSKKTGNGIYLGKKVEYYTVTKKCNMCGYTTNVLEIRPITGGGGGGASGGTTIEKPYAEGGVNDYTGLAMLHGTPTKPEGILNAEDYKAWKQDIKTTNLLYNALATVSTAQRNAAAAANSIGSQNAGVNIENAVVNMNTTIANDYDARRAGEQALEQMLTIARKSGTRSAQRR